MKDLINKYNWKAAIYLLADDPSLSDVRKLLEGVYAHGVECKTVELPVQSGPDIHMKYQRYRTQLVKIEITILCSEFKGQVEEILKNFFTKVTSINPTIPLFATSFLTKSANNSHSQQVKAIDIDEAGPLRVLWKKHPVGGWELVWIQANMVPDFSNATVLQREILNEQS